MSKVSETNRDSTLMHAVNRFEMFNQMDLVINLAKFRFKYLRNIQGIIARLSFAARNVHARNPTHPENC